jgi:hypothetical protein
VNFGCVRNYISKFEDEQALSTEDEWRELFSPSFTRFGFLAAGKMQQIAV